MLMCGWVRIWWVHGKHVGMMDSQLEVCVCGFGMVGSQCEMYVCGCVIGYVE